MKRPAIAGALAGVYGAGVATMYFLDPQRGKRRRADLQDVFVHSRRELEKFAGRLGRDFGHRTEGAIAEAQRIFERKPASDYVLEQRVHSALGRVLSHPSAVQVSVKDGSVYLSGWILAGEAKEAEKAVRSVEGITDFTSYLTTTEHPEHISALQGGRQRKRVPELLQQRWSPTARLLAGMAGLGLAAYGIIRRKTAASVAGSLVLARSVVNIPWAGVAGLDPSLGIHVQKTVYIAASPAELYQFWNNPENYPKALPHVQQVTRLEDDTYQWQLAGLAGTNLRWTGSIIRRIPDKLIEWRSLPGSAVENHGTIHLEPAKDGRTRVQVQMSYQPPAGLLGHAFAAMLGLDPKRMLDQDFVQLKSLFEQGVTRVHGHDVTKSELEKPSAS